MSTQHTSTDLRIVMAQLNFMVGDIHSNTDRIIAASIRARDKLAADAIVFPELAITGYPPEDLLLRVHFIERVEEAVERICREVRGITVITGYPLEEAGDLYNAAGVIQDGSVAGLYRKQRLPNYSVFDEKRYFKAGTAACVVTIKNTRVGITICEDIWEAGPAQQAADSAAALLVNLNASPFHAGKQAQREQLVAERARETGLPVMYVNLVGGQDELVFDGASFVVSHDGDLVQRAPACMEDLYPVDFQCGEIITPLPGERAIPRENVAAIYEVLVLGVRDYIGKHHFSGAVIGLSGGIDSALTLAIAVDAIGADQVEAVMMPSRYTADMSIEDARAEAEVLGVSYESISIEAPFGAFLDVLEEVFAGTETDTTEENIQARCRGVILMAISNKKRKILLTTGNKSEMSVGYATLYGDMAGGFAPIKDVPKLLVYQLAEYRNSIAPVIPQRVLDRPPSAELAPDQKDADSLPAYEVLDPILECYIELDESVEQIAARGFDKEVVEYVARMVDRNEYKRRQAPPGVRISQRSFGRDRRYPITAVIN
jgi:NAD+ synthase (glutamine-hydrolysing)